MCVHFASSFAHFVFFLSGISIRPFLFILFYLRPIDTVRPKVAYAMVPTFEPPCNILCGTPYTVDSDFPPLNTEYKKVQTLGDDLH